MKWIFLLAFLLPTSAVGKDFLIGDWEHFHKQLGEWRYSKLSINEDFSSELTYHSALVSSSFNAAPNALNFSDGALTITFEYSDKAAYPPPFNKLVLNLVFDTSSGLEKSGALKGYSVWFFDNDNPSSITEEMHFSKDGLESLLKLVQKLNNGDPDRLSK